MFRFVWYHRDEKKCEPLVVAIKVPPTAVVAVWTTGHGHRWAVFLVCYMTPTENYHNNPPFLFFAFNAAAQWLRPLEPHGYVVFILFC
jgi:hypothetical protein